MDGKRWENDWKADKYIPAPFSNTDNSVVICIPSETDLKAAAKKTAAKKTTKKSAAKK